MQIHTYIFPFAKTKCVVIFNCWTNSCNLYAGTKIVFFLHKERINLMCNICRIYKKDQIIKNLLFTAFQKVLSLGRQRSSLYWLLSTVFIKFDMFTVSKTLSSVTEFVKW